MSACPYLFFEGACEEALDFYKSALDAEVVMMMRYSDAPRCDGPSHVPPGSENKVMHANFKVAGAEIMASDGFCKGNAARKFDGFSIAITAPDVATTDRYFHALAKDGDVHQPLTETFFSPRFGVVVDRFGLGWMVSTAAAQG